MLQIYLCWHSFLVAFTTQCWEVLNNKENMFKDGSCLQINKLMNGTEGWHTNGGDDWIYYPQQTVNVSMTAATISASLVGGCCAPNRYKPSGFLYQDDGSTYKQTGNKIVAISNLPMQQNINVTGWYMKKFVDNRAMNLTVIPSIHHPDKQSILFEIAAFDRGMIVNYQFYNFQDKLIANYSTGLLRNVITIPDITLPRYTRRILVQFYGSRADPMCFSYLYAGLYVYAPFSTLYQTCSQVANLLQYLSLANFICIPIIFGIMTMVTKFTFPPPIRFLCRTPSHKVLMCIIIMLGSFILNQAWNLINSQSSIFHEWLPRAAKIVELFLSFFLYAVYFYPVFLCYHASYRSRIANLFGAFTTCTLFGLRLTLDLPTYAITFARSLPFLIINLLAAFPTFVAYCVVLIYFVTRYITFQSCVMCSIEYLEVQDIEEQYVRNLIKSRRGDQFKERKGETLFGTLWDIINTRIWEFKFTSIVRSARDPVTLKMWFRKLFGLNEYVRIPFAIKTSLTLLIYCLGQLIPLLLTQMVGVGGVVPVRLCSWSPYLAQFQYHPNPMEFAVKTFYLLEIATFVATIGGGGLCMIYSLGIIRRFTKDILLLRKGNYFLFKGKKNNGIDLDDAIRFLGVVIGFGFTGALYFMVEIFILGAFITALIKMDRFRDALFQRVGYGVFFASFFIAFIVQLLQKCITNLIFVENRTRFSIQHRSPFLHYWYFMMLTSMTRALTSYIIRTLKLILRYPLFSVRVDRNAETWSVRRGDGGFTAYCGMLLAEHEYNNPVVLAFIECILDSTGHIHSSENTETHKKGTARLCKSHQKKTNKKRVSKNEKDIEKVDHSISLIDSLKDKKEHKQGVSKRARTRWFLAYTLVHNPVFRQYRVRELKTTK
ncbi:unnamed protein product [Mucor hiemalis]